MSVFKILYSHTRRYAQMRTFTHKQARRSVNVFDRDLHTHTHSTDLILEKLNELAEENCPQNHGVSSLCDYITAAQQNKLADPHVIGKIIDNHFIPILQSCKSLTHEDIQRLVQCFTNLRIHHAPLFELMAECILQYAQSSKLEATDAQTCLSFLSTQTYKHSNLLEIILSTLHTELKSTESQVRFLNDLCLLNETENQMFNDVMSAATDGIWQEGTSLRHKSSLLKTQVMCANNTFDKKLKDELLRVIEMCVDDIDESVLESDLKNPLRRTFVSDVLTSAFAFRHLHKTAYEELPSQTRIQLRDLYEHDALLRSKPSTKFCNKVSGVLSDLRIAHDTGVQKGPFTFDIIEKNRKLIWQCNHMSRFYLDSNEKLAEVSWQERVAKGMGYSVANTAYWQWGKMKANRTRVEYIRMSRYYALRDRRQHDEEFEGWTLPYIQYKSKHSNSLMTAQYHWNT